MGFDHPKDIHRQKLIRSGRVAKPSLIAKINEQLSTLVDKPTDEIAKDGLLTNQRGKFPAAKGEDRVLTARNKVACRLLQTLRPREFLVIGQIFSE